MAKTTGSGAQAADRRQLEDEPQPPRGDRADPEDRVQPARGRCSSAVEVVVLPPFVDLRSVQTLVDGDRLLLRYGAQDLSPHDSGAYTGDIGGPMLAKLGCSYVVVGHSERRQYHDETDEVVNAKLAAAFRNGLTPILCVGEPLEVRRTLGQVGHCSTQVDGALAGLTGRAGRLDRHRLRAGLGDRHRRGRHARRRAGGLRRDPDPAGRALHARAGRRRADPLRRLGQGGQRRRAAGPGRRRRCPGRRSQPRCRRLRRHLRGRAPTRGRCRCRCRRACRRRPDRCRLTRQGLWVPAAAARARAGKMDQVHPQLTPRSQRGARRH